MSLYLRAFIAICATFGLYSMQTAFANPRDGKAKASTALVVQEKKAISWKKDWQARKERLEVTVGTPDESFPRDAPLFSAPGEQMEELFKRAALRGGMDDYYDKTYVLVLHKGKEAAAWRNLEYEKAMKTLADELVQSLKEVAEIEIMLPSSSEDADMSPYRSSGPHRQEMEARKHELLENARDLLVKAELTAESIAKYEFNLETNGNVMKVSPLTRNFILFRNKNITSRGGQRVFGLFTLPLVAGETYLFSAPRVFLKQRALKKKMLEVFATSIDNELPGVFAESTVKTQARLDSAYARIFSGEIFATPPSRQLAAPPSGGDCARGQLEGYLGELKAGPKP